MIIKAIGRDITVSHNTSPNKLSISPNFDTQICKPDAKITMGVKSGKMDNLKKIFLNLLFFFLRYSPAGMLKIMANKEENTATIMLL